MIDPRYEEEVSGCTATVAVIANNKIYVVCLTRANTEVADADLNREMLVIRELSWVSRDVQSHSLSTTSHKTRVGRRGRKFY